MELMLPKGTRDFLPEDKILRDFIVEILKQVFEKYGFQPLETPAFERLETLTAKFAAGEGSDALKETFRFKDQGSRDLGLKYDLTVPTARVIGMNPNLKMPFKRYQIERVFRDGPVESNRYREFLQCDVDVVGVKSAIADAEILAIMQEAFKKLELIVELLVNDRKLLFEIMSFAKIPKDRQEKALIAIDKLDKLSRKEVEKELQNSGLKEKEINALFELIETKGSNEQVLSELNKKIPNSQGVKELEELLEYCNAFNVSVKITPSLVRGLAYYTGPIFEAKSKESIVKGSLAGGGRWDEMIAKFLGSEREFPATGTSFGVERIFDALKKKQISAKKTKNEIFVIPVGISFAETIPIVQKIRSLGINADFDLQGKGLSKNLDYCNKQGIKIAVIVGENELKAGELTVKNLQSGRQEKVKFKELEKVKEILQTVQKTTG
jgi:histidyl-tRNA synthetase